jgi:hypothetical protein
MKLKATSYLRPLKRIIERTGADYIQVAHMVELKLRLDNRKPQLNSSGKAQNPKNTLIRQSIMFLFIGTFMGLFAMRTSNPFIFGLVAHSYLMVMLSVSMLSEYSISLFDTRDNNLILPLPINGQTLGWSRVMHIMIYLLLFFLSIASPMYVIAGIKFGAATSVLMFASGIMNTLFTLFLTIFLYMGLMAFTQGEKLKDILMYIQVGFAIVIMVGYQFLSRSIVFSPEPNPLFSSKMYFLFIPPAWFAYLAEIGHRFNIYILLGSFFAIIIPLASLYFVTKKMFKGFENKLTLLGTEQSKQKENSAKPQQTSLWAIKMFRWVLGIAPNEMPLFKLMWHMGGRERLFKQNILPMLGYTLVLPIFMLFADKNQGSMSMRYEIFMYFTIMISSMLPTSMSIGSNAYSGWIFQTMPHLRGSTIFTATLKAVFARFFIPVFVLMSAPLFYIKGIMALPGLITLFVFNYTVSIAILMLQTPYLPFSQVKSGSQGGKAAFKMFGVMLFSIPFGVLHFFLSSKNEWFVLLPTIILIPLMILIERYWMPRKIAWKLIEIVNRV